MIPTKKSQKPAPTQPTNPDILLTENCFMEPEKVIIVFFKWLRENPSIFMPTAWQDLPKLDTEIAESADDELFPIAMTISKWCAHHGLGDTLREQARKDIDDAGEPTPTTQQMLTNTTQTLRQDIEETYEKLQQLDAQKLDKDNDSK
ncbi:MAG: hypothetical protein EAZ78_28250 [Oscillatoriales cyanobacterium]|nr:MAG: hypothetical protein EAZ78_28250 [Oscillatoriales cyanobacterium]